VSVDEQRAREDKIARIIFVVILTTIGFFVYAGEADGARWDWASKKGGWCCAKPRKWCRDATVCTNASTDPRGGGFCRQYEVVNVCTDTCDEWAHEAGGRGGSCRGGR
jgi:hypothetical protein